MKRFLPLAVFIISCLHLSAQPFPVSSITISLPSSPDPNTANWGSGTSLFSISATARLSAGKMDPQLEMSRILVLIKKTVRKYAGLLPHPVHLLQILIQSTKFGPVIMRML